MNKQATSKCFVAITAILLASVGMASARPDEAQTNELPAIISTVAPSIRPVCFTARLGGDVTIDVVIGPDGIPISAQPSSGHPLLKEATENAVVSWRFASGTEGARTVRLVFVYPQLTYGNPVSIIVLPYQAALKVEPPLYFKPPEIESQIPADWRPGRDRCRVHRHEILKKDKVKIIYGLLAFSGGYERAERVLFPNAKIVAYGGCVIMTDPDSGKVSPSSAEVLYCPQCRIDEKRWSKTIRRTKS